jgi:hypothetical protein
LLPEQLQLQWLIPTSDSLAMDVCRIKSFNSCNIEVLSDVSAKNNYHPTIALEWEAVFGSAGSPPKLGLPSSRESKTQLLLLRKAKFLVFCFETKCGSHGLPFVLGGVLFAQPRVS